MSGLPEHLDLHLIRILYLLLQEQNVSRVAIKLKQPQPSISLALRKLRALTDDQLLVRGAHGMVPTQYGASLLEPAKQILDAIDRLFANTIPFVPQQDGKTFRIAAPDYLDSQFLPNIVAQIHSASPKSRVIIHSLGPDTDYNRLLSDGELDLVIANWDDPPPQLHRSKLFDDALVCVMSADSPYAKRTDANGMTVTDYLSLPHVGPATMLPGYHGVIETYLASQNLQRNLMVESFYFGLIPHMLTQTNLVLTTGKQFVRFYEKTMPLKSFAVPIAFPPIQFYQLWHDRVHQAPEHMWLRAQVVAVTEALLAAA